MPKIDKMRTGWVGGDYFSPVILKDTEDFLQNFVSHLKENTQLLEKIDKLQQKLGTICDQIKQAKSMGAEGKKYLSAMYKGQMTISSSIDKAKGEIYHIFNEYLTAESEKNAGARFIKMAMDKIGHSGTTAGAGLKNGIAERCYKIICGQRFIKDEALTISENIRQYIGTTGYNEVAYDLYRWKQGVSATPAANTSAKRQQAAKGLQNLEDTSYGKPHTAETQKPAGGKPAKIKTPKKPSGGARKHDPNAKNVRGKRSRTSNKFTRWGTRVLKLEIEK